MVRYFLILMLGGVGLPMILGCSSGEPLTAPVYDPCYEVVNCVSAADRCAELTVQFAGFDYTNAICTLGCEVEGELSPDCPRAVIGRAGSCYPASVAGGISDALICFEPCDVDGDCFVGFRCLGAQGLCPPSGTDCPIAEGDAICVPGPN